MSWSLSSETSQVDESPGDESKIGFRGSRFSVGARDLVFIRDYYDKVENKRLKTYYKDSFRYVSELRAVMGDYWDGRFRIRGNGDTYCVSGQNSWTYVGNTELGDEEVFKGYRIASPAPDYPNKKPPYLYGGAHNHGQVGERWTIPPEGYADYADAIGNVGVKMKRNDWIWSSSLHTGFIDYMRRLFYPESNNFLRFYITCHGYVVRPIKEFWWDQGYYGIDGDDEISMLNIDAPKGANSAYQRLHRADRDPTLYFVCGHIDDIMGGEPPMPNLSDWRVKTVDQDIKRKWG